MDTSNFKHTLTDPEPPPGLSIIMKALWYDGKGDWDRAHQLAQSSSSADAAWVHAYLHRKDGDNGNASYWYNQAGKNFPKMTLVEEWEDLVQQLI